MGKLTIYLDSDRGRNKPLMKAVNPRDYNDYDVFIRDSTWADHKNALKINWKDVGIERWKEVSCHFEITKSLPASLQKVQGNWDPCDIHELEKNSDPRDKIFLMSRGRY